MMQKVYKVIQSSNNIFKIKEIFINMKKQSILNKMIMKNKIYKNKIQKNKFYNHEYHIKTKMYKFN